MTPAQRQTWFKLSLNKRRILLSHRPDELEEELNMKASIMTALVNVYGPREFDQESVRVEEGDGEGERTGTESGPEMTYDEIGAALGGLSRERVRMIINQALMKLAKAFQTSEAECEQQLANFSRHSRERRRPQNKSGIKST